RASTARHRDDGPSGGAGSGIRADCRCSLQFDEMTIFYDKLAPASTGTDAPAPTTNNPTPTPPPSATTPTPDRQPHHAHMTLRVAPRRGRLSAPRHPTSVRAPPTPPTARRAR